GPELSPALYLPGQLAQRVFKFSERLPSEPLVTGRKASDALFEDLMAAKEIGRFLLPILNSATRVPSDGRPEEKVTRYPNGQQDDNANAAEYEVAKFVDLVRVVLQLSIDPEASRRCAGKRGKPDLISTPRLVGVLLLWHSGVAPQTLYR